MHLNNSLKFPVYFLYACVFVCSFVCVRMCVCAGTRVCVCVYLGACTEIWKSDKADDGKHQTIMATCYFQKYNLEIYVGANDFLRVRLHFKASERISSKGFNVDTLKYSRCCLICNAEVLNENNLQLGDKSVFGEAKQKCHEKTEKTAI